MVNEMPIGYEEYKKQDESFKQSIPKSGDVVWLYAMIRGRWSNLGRFADETSATDYALSHVNQYKWELYKTNTTNIAEVQRRFKRYILDRTSDLGQATSLISRKPAEEKKKKDALLYELF
jgi:hypothetical protein